MSMRFPTATWPETRKVLGRHLRQVPGALSQFIFSIVLLGVGAVANIWIPIQLGRIVDVVISEASTSLVRISIELVIAALVAAIFSAWGFFVLSRLTERVIANLRENMVGTALGLPVHRVEDAGTGDLVSRSTDDVAELSAA
ncbi:ABC transporter transmembrane domain-containing protein, partial [Corynebacterium casei]